MIDLHEGANELYIGVLSEWMWKAFTRFWRA